MDTRSTFTLPEALQTEIALYLSEGEKIIDALSSASGPVGKLGELWMIVTDRTLFFYTREFSKNPVVALISRVDVKVITYTQTQTGLNLTFQPRNHPLNTVRVPFPSGQIKEVNRICEELAKSIPFEMIMDKSRAIPEKPSPRPVLVPKSPVSPAPENPAPAESPSEPVSADVRLSSGDISSFRYIALASLISLLVGYLWYRLFVSISDHG
ncbi:MAG: hypothetical protein WA705_26695 [Candidatus Ozemobacteraceae bacterium]